MRLRERALFGDDFQPKSEAGKLLAACRMTRAYLSWIKPHAYAALVLSDQLKGQQRRILDHRRARQASVIIGDGQIGGAK